MRSARLATFTECASILHPIDPSAYTPSSICPDRMRCSTQEASTPAAWRDCCNDRTPGRTKPDHEGVDETRPVASPGCCAASRACCVTRDQHVAPDARSY